MSTEAPLTPAQTHALFDILIHHQLYAEIEAFKYPNTITTYGFPFRKDDGVQTTSPLLQSMFNKTLLRLPGLKSVSLEFWRDKIKTMVQKMGEAELSESYDKGAIGSRKAMATAVSSILEYVARGMLGGYSPKRPKKDTSGKEEGYDVGNADDLLRAFDDTMREAIYGDLLEEAFRKTAATGKLEDHSQLVQATHEYIIINLASFLHHTFIMTPDGQYLLRLLENVHRLIPYYLIKQTLRVGNAATMINGMVKLVLIKISVTAVTNWIGLTNNANDGMNLMQQIISTVMAWDTSEFQKRAQKLEGHRDAPDKKVFKAVKSFVYASRDKHDAARNMSIAESKSIICVILETSDPPIPTESVSELQHDIAMEYYSTLLSIRDREELVKVLCKLQPDILTSSLRDVVSAFDPIIRKVHSAVDLSGTVTDAEAFLTDLIKISKPKRKGNGSRAPSPQSSRSTSPAPIPDNAPASVADGGAVPLSSTPTVEDYVQLLRKHAPSAHKFLHQVTKNAPELANEYLDLAKAWAAEFRVHDISSAKEGGESGAGNMSGPLQSLFFSLPADKQTEMKEALDHHENHLRKLKSTSQTRMKAIISSCTRPGSSNANASTAKPTSQARGTTHGPGMYLAQWHSLLDSTLITPATMHGPVRKGYEVKGELDGKGFKVDTILLKRTDKNKEKDKKKNDSDEGVGVADGTGDVLERKERKTEAVEQERTEKVWMGMKDGWVGVCKGLEVMGDE